MTKSLQKQVYEQVARRGYREGWTPEQFAARQVAKLQEELGELALKIVFFGGYENPLDEDLQWVIQRAAAKARERFDQETPWRTAGVLEDLRDELADCQVVLFCLAEAVNEMAGGELNFDIAWAAIEKARADRKRGKRLMDVLEENE